MNFYEFDQNNSGGYFDVDENLCHKLIIEAENFEEAVQKAESLGCYWDGVENGVDCPCCGDRWSNWEDLIDIEKYKNEGYTAEVFCGIYKNTEKEWNKKYGRYEVLEAPSNIISYGIKSYSGKIKFKDIEEYAQFMADEYGWTSPDIRIFYKNGEVKEIFGRIVGG